MTQNILTKILDTKTHEVALARQQINDKEIQAQAERSLQQDPTRSFFACIQHCVMNKNPAIIAEIKRASPSKGLLREDFEPAAIARDYAQHGATCLSVLTDEHYFKGSPLALHQARVACSLPILRKDFLIDPYQIYQSRVMGADCILLIVSALTTQQLKIFSKIAEHLKMSVLVEVHNRDELRIALDTLDTPLIGINNRNLKTFEVTLDTTLNLLPHIPKDRIVITESGILSHHDAQRMLQHQVYGFLIGEFFMREASPGQALENMFSSTVA